MAPLARQGIEPYATWASLSKDAPIKPFHDPQQINVVIVGGQTNPLWQTTDFLYTQSAVIDIWRPTRAVRRDARPIRMPGAATCSEGTCGLPC